MQHLILYTECISIPTKGVWSETGCRHLSLSLSLQLQFENTPITNLDASLPKGKYTLLQLFD